MQDFWNDRYGVEEYAFGKEPNEFFKNSLASFNLKGNILLPAEGEGRNAVFAAKSGLKVTAFDMSSQGRNKAIKLASEEQVEIDYLIGDLPNLSFNENSFECMALIYAHFPADIKSNYHKQLSTYLKKDGVVILEGFSKNNLAQKEKYPEIGGPPVVDMLFSEEEIKNDFSDFEILELREEIIPLNEGRYHKGMGSVIRFVGKKL